MLVLLPDSPRFTMVAATEARLAATHTTRETLGRGLFELFPDNPDDAAATGMNNLRASLERVRATRAADTMAVQKYDIRGPDGAFQVKYWSPKNIPLAFALAHLTTVERSLAIVEATLPLDPAVAPHWQRALARLREMQFGLVRIQELVGKLRIFSRLDEGERKRKRVRESVESVLMILQHRTPSEVMVSTHFGEPDLIDCYAELLNQAVMNLTSNALDSITGPGTITITTGASAGWFEIAVTDTGRGMSEAVRARVFEPFFTTKTVGEGTGLGLAISYSIAKKHGGDIELQSEPGQGTRAVLRFPLVH